MDMKTRLLFLPLLLVLVVSLAACGGGSGTVPANAVAVVNGKPISTAYFNAVFAQFQANSVASGAQPAAPGSPQYKQLQDQTIAYLVQFAEVKQQAPKENVSVSQDEVTKYLV